MRRAAWISLACLLAALLLAGWRAQFDVRREGAGAAGVASLMGHLSLLQSVPPQDIDNEILSLRALGQGGELRHLRFSLEDGQGRVLIRPVPPPEEDGGRPIILRLTNFLQSPGEPASRSWRLARQDGRVFRITLIGNPASEGQEAWGNILGMAGVLLFYSVTLLAGVYWAVRHAFAPLRNILSTVGAWERQDYACRLPSMPIRELDTLGSALNHLAQALEASREERRQLSLKVQSLQEEERARLARELHDEFAQAVTAMRADAAWLARKVAEPDLKAVAEDLGQRCADLHQHMRGVLRQLRPGCGEPGGETLPLGQLMDELVRDWQRLPDQGIAYACSLDLDDSPIPRALVLAIYRLSQEALTNAARHAGACRVEVSLRARAGQDIAWQVRDSGSGIADLDRALCRGNGLAGMRERVWAHGGDIEIDSGEGLRITARFPWTEGETA